MYPTNFLIILAVIVYICALVTGFEADRSLKEMGKKTFRLKGIFKYLIIRARRIRTYKNDDGYETKENIIWHTFDSFKNSVTRFILFWQIAHHIYFWSIIASMFFGLNRFNVFMILELVLSGVYPIIAIVVILVAVRGESRVSREERLLKAEQLVEKLTKEEAIKKGESIE